MIATKTADIMKLQTICLLPQIAFIWYFFMDVTSLVLQQYFFKILETLFN